MEPFQKLMIPLAVLIAFTFGYFMVPHGLSKNSTITMEVAPASAQISVDGKDTNAGNIKVPAGIHTVTVSRKGFAEQSQAITTTVAGTEYAGFVLEPNSNETKNWYTENLADQTLAGGINSHISDHESRSAIASNSLLQQLPISFGDGHGGLVSMSSGIPISSKSKDPAIYITADLPTDRQSALEWIDSHGYDPATMDIVFRNQMTSYAPVEDE